MIMHGASIEILRQLHMQEGHLAELSGMVASCSAGCGSCGPGCVQDVVGMARRGKMRCVLAEPAISLLWEVPMVPSFGPDLGSLGWEKLGLAALRRAAGSLSNRDASAGSCLEHSPHCWLAPHRYVEPLQPLGTKGEDAGQPRLNSCLI